jgi:hypothetical protein
MNDTKSFSFSEALITPEHAVFNVILKPFSLGHWVFLDSYQSPLLQAEEYPEEISNDPSENYRNCIRHMMLFVLTCSHSYEDNKRLIEDVEFFNQTKVIMEENLSKYIHRNKNWNIFEEVNKVRNYLDYYINSMPHFVETGNPSPPSGIDWMQSLYAVMKNEYGYTESQIMNMSMRRIYSEWVAFAAKNGTITVKTKQQLQAEKEAYECAAKAREEILKEKEKS